MAGDQNDKPLIRQTGGGIDYSDKQTPEFSEFVAQWGYFRPADLDAHPALRQTGKRS